MEWIEDVREAMREAVPEIPTTDFKLTGRRSERRRTGVRLAQMSLHISGGRR